MSPAAGAAAPARAEALRLSPHCLALPGDGVLHLVTRRGAFDLQGRDTARLHERLSPFLQGSHTQDEILAAVPAALAERVRGYLDRLRAVGALAGPEGGGPRPRVRLDGPLPPREGRPGLCFVSAAQAGALLLRAGRGAGRAGTLTCVVVEPGSDPSDPAERGRRAVLARWLLRSERALAPDRPRLRLFTRGPDGATLARVVDAEGREGPDGPDLSVVPDQLGLVRPLDVDQLPLVAATAAHPWFAPRVAAYGLGWNAVRAHLLRLFVARLLRVPDAEACVAATPAEARLKLLERVAAERAEAEVGRWTAGDLLAETDGDHPAAALLREALREGLPGLPARWRRTADGLTVMEAGGRRAASFLPGRARALLLAALARERFLPRGGPLPGDAVAVVEPGELADPEALRALVRDRAAEMARRGGLPAPGVRRLRRWGVEAWVPARPAAAGGGAP